LRGKRAVIRDEEIYEKFRRRKDTPSAVEEKIKVREKRRGRRGTLEYFFPMKH